MAGLTPLDAKLGKALGLAQAGQRAPEKVGVQRGHVERVREASLALAAHEATG